MHYCHDASTLSGLHSQANRLPDRLRSAQASPGLIGFLQRPETGSVPSQLDLIRGARVSGSPGTSDPAILPGGSGASMERRAAGCYNCRSLFAENRTMNLTVPVLVSLLSLAACAAFARAADDAADDAAPASEPKVIRAGIIGLDTSHAPAFTDLFNGPKATP